MKLKTNDKRKIRKFMNVWKLNITLLNNQWIKEEIKEKILEVFILTQIQMETHIQKLVRCNKGSFKREAHCYKCLH